MAKILVLTQFLGTIFLISNLEWSETKLPDFWTVLTFPDWGLNSDRIRHIFDKIRSFLLLKGHKNGLKPPTLTLFESDMSFVLLVQDHQGDGLLGHHMAGLQVCNGRVYFQDLFGFHWLMSRGLPPSGDVPTTYAGLGQVTTRPVCYLTDRPMWVKDVAVCETLQD